MTFWNAAHRASNWLLDNLHAGDCIEVLQPAGVFVPRSLEGDLLLLGAGSGITPLMAILQAALIEGRGRVWLLYASRDAASIIFAVTVTRSALPVQIGRPRWRKSHTAALILGAICFYAIGLSAIICWIQPHGEWDAWAIWNLHARFLYRGAGDWPG